MKQFLRFGIIMAILGCAIFSVNDVQAQAATYTLKGMTAAGVVKAKDTTTNTDTTYLVYSTDGSTVGSFNYYEDITYEWVNTSITGTCAGTVIAQGSNTGTFAGPTNAGDWVTLVSDVAQYNGSSSITVSVGMLSQYFVFPNNKFKYIRLRYISSGTQTSVLTGTVRVMPHG
jgi:hypothetical protein